MAKAIIPLLPPKMCAVRDSTTLGKFVRARRNEAGLGIYDAAVYCGVAVSTLSKIEEENGDVRMSSVFRVCKMLGIQLNVECWEEE